MLIKEMRDSDQVSPFEGDFRAGVEGLAPLPPQNELGRIEMRARSGLHQRARWAIFRPPEKRVDFST
jgi:hypothetical protein